MENYSLAKYALRVAIAGEFIGHGAFALQGKQDWIGWFAKFGITDAELAAKLLFVIGLADLAVALIVLLRPVNVVLLWAVFWGFWTALMRPIVGMPIWDFIERWANWGAPLALLFLLGWPKTSSEWFSLKSRGDEMTNT